MSTIIITYEAKCKHCLHFEYVRITKKDGNPSKRMQAYCSNKDSEYYHQHLTLKSKACEKLEL